MDSEFISACESIKVTGSQIKDSGFKKHVSYNINGSDSRGVFQINRRYKEFIALREILLNNWPGCYVPLIPPKKAIGNLDTSFIETRQQQLERFLVQVSQASYFYESSEFQTFIRGPEDYAKASQGMKKLTLVEVGEKYLEMFLGEHPSVTDQEILEIETFLRATLAKLENIEVKCKKNISNCDQFFKLHSRCFASLNELNEKYKAYGVVFGNIKIEDARICALKKQLVWIQGEILDFLGMIEIIRANEELKKTKEKLEEKVETDKRNLAGFQSGRKSFIQKIRNKSESENIADGEKSLEESTKTLQASEKICLIVPFRFVKVLIPRFKQEKNKQFSQMLSNYILETGEYLIPILEQSKSIHEIYEYKLNSLK